MADLHVYFGVENIALTPTQRGQFVTALQQLGADNNSFQPNLRNHWRIRLDNNAVIFEALFDEDTISIAAIKQFLANIFGVAVGTINHAVQSTARGLVITFSRNSTDYIRMIAFGMNDGSWPSWDVSNEQARAYLAANAAAWGEEVV